MKRVVFIVIVSCLMVSCGNKKAENSSARTDEVTKSEAITQVYPLDDLLEVADRFVDKTVTVRGSVTHTCKHSGKKCFIVGENGAVTMRVEAKGAIETFNKELVGSELEITGILKETRMTKEEIDQLEKETNEKMLAKEESEESCQSELDNISQMRDWMKAKNKDHYSVYYMDGQAYEVL